MRPPNLGKRMIGLLAAYALSAFVAAGQGLSPADLKIQQSRKAIAAEPTALQPHNDLALALSRRARETGNPGYYDEAEEVLKKSLEIAPGNWEAEKTRVWILLGKHRFSEALEKARDLNKRMPDDVMVYGLRADAAAELGNYEEAEAAVQWMLDMGRGGIPALTRAAYLREIFGDIEGAIEFMDLAYGRTAVTEVEDRAWILTQAAHLHMLTSRLELGEALLQKALSLFPDYHYALAGLAEVRSAQGRSAEAVQLLKRRYEAASHPENLLALAAALERAGRKSEAKSAYASFEERALGESEGPDNANHELVFYYTDHARKPAAALRIARLEAARRNDVHTLHAYAWALHANGQHAKAREQIEKVLAVGIRDPKIFYHAGLICARLGDKTSAVRFFTATLSLAPNSEAGPEARKQLRRVSK